LPNCPGSSPATPAVELFVWGAGAWGPAAGSDAPQGMAEPHQSIWWYLGENVFKKAQK